MSEYTSVYLREKASPLLSYREDPSLDEIEGKTEEEINEIYKDIHAYNESVEETFGCELFYLTTTPSRQLSVLPWTFEPKPLKNDLLKDVIDFYNEEITSYENIISKRKDDIERYEARIIKATPELYDKIEEDIFDCKQSIEDCREEMSEMNFLRSKFIFLQEIMDLGSNSDRYELIYTKC